MELPVTGDGVYLVRIKDGRPTWVQRLGSKWGPVVVVDPVTGQTEVIQDLADWATSRGYDELAQSIHWRGDIVSFITRYLGLRVYYSPESVSKEILHQVPGELEADPVPPQWSVGPDGEPTHWDWLGDVIRDLIYNEQILDVGRATWEEAREDTLIVGEVATDLIAKKLVSEWAYSPELANRMAKRVVRQRLPLIFRTIREIQKDWISSERFDGEDRGDGFPNRPMVWWKRQIRRGLVGGNWRPLE